MTCPALLLAKDPERATSSDCCCSHSEVGRTCRSLDGGRRTLGTLIGLAKQPDAVAAAAAAEKATRAFSSG